MLYDRLQRYFSMSSEEVIRNQEDKLRDFIQHQLYPFSPYYRRLFDDKGIDPRSIRRIKDLELVPLTRKEDIMPSPENPKRYKDFILQPDPEKIKRHWPKSVLAGMRLKELVGIDVKKEIREEYYPSFMIATSGTTGNNVPFMYTRKDILQLSENYAYTRELTGMKDEYVLLNVFPFAPHLAFIFAYWVNIVSSIRMFHTGGGSITSTDKTLDVLRAVDANILVGIPSYVYHLLRKAQEKGTDLSSIKLIGTAGEKLSRGARERMLDILKERGARDVGIFDLYGTTEMRDAYCECAPGSGTYHIHPNIHIAEIVDPQTGEQKAEGEAGALAITNIDGRGTVVCRYLIGDIFEGGLKYGKCPHCGCSVPRLVGPIGRMRDYSSKLEMAKLKGTLLNLNVFHELLPGIDGVDEWQVILEKKNDDPHDLDILRINIAPAPGYDAADLKRVVGDAVNDAIEIKALVDTSFTSDQLFEAMGGKLKTKRILDRRPRD
ncbi:MAG: AMP-binding protein [Candidatus Thermoplasmatota archaeon]|nr:AMP-binding protein [Candidatus Thermoplasmatota archaeon]